MRNPTRKEVYLGALGLVFVIVLGVQFRRGAFSSPSAAAAQRAAVLEDNPASRSAIVGVDLNYQPEVRIKKNSRNLFNYSRSPDEVAQERKMQDEALRLAQEAEKRRREQQQAEAAQQARLAAERANLPPPPPQPPAIAFKFIGKMGDARAPIAILADGSEVLTVREGEVISKQFKVRKIEFDSVTIGYTNPDWADQTKTLRMGS